MNENDISGKIIGCAIEVHKALGPGLLESAYEECLFYELMETGLKVERQKPLPVVYKEVKLEAGYRVDLLVEEKVISINFQEFAKHIISIKGVFSFCGVSP